MGRTKGAKNKPKFKSLQKNTKPTKIDIKHKKRCNIMANVNDVLNAVTNLNSAVDTLVANIQNIKGTDTQPAIDAINSVTAKIQSIQLPS